MIEINCHFCGESYAAHIILGRNETRMQPSEPDTAEPEACPSCGEDTDAGLAVELYKDRCGHEADESADCERKREDE